MIGETAEIGDRVTLYQGVTLGGTGFQRGKRHPTLGDNVTVGSGAKLLGPIAVGDGAKVGANTVVVEDVPPGATVVGNPGHPVRVEGRRVEGPDADWIHLPDPIAEAIKALSERIAELERAPRRARRRQRRRRRGADGAAAPHRPLLGRRLSASASRADARRAPGYARQAMLQSEFEIPPEAADRPSARRPRPAPTASSGCSPGSTRPSARRSSTARGRCWSSPAPARARPGS